jgi:hypothetical protein
MDIRTASADFSAPLRGSGPRTASQAVIFPRPVDRVAVGIVGYSVAFGDHSDHAVGRVQIQVESTISDNVVTVTATLGLRDFSGSWDDDYQGTVDFAVLADLAPAGSPRPREDMLIVDMEVNQAVQFFRAARFLDGATVLPDNAIVLVENKTTGFRCYVDYDAFAGLPPVATLTGEMTVRTGSTTFTRTPINGGGGIVPMADAAINQASADNTLNFMLEGAWCVGTVTVSVQVWDAVDPLTKSAVFTRTLNFHPVVPLDIFVLGVHYTAQSLDLAAPSQADIVNAMGRLRSTYPVGDVSINGYSTLDFNEDVNYTITASGGCGDGMSHLLNKLDDMKGGSSDIYAGFLPDLALIRTPRSNIGGCGQVGQGAIFIDQTGDVPHEVGHALGRNHAPCSTGRCNPPPANVDGNYPQYGALPAGSIGVFGFDPASNTVFDPAQTADFMAYWGPQWVSAYTYMALGGAFPQTGGGSGASVANGHALGDVPVETLMLRLVVARDRTVRRLPSFHFPAIPRSFGDGCSEFTVELLDEARRTIMCAPIDCGCRQSGCHCWPRNMRGAIPYPPAARWMLVYEGDRKIHEELIPQPRSLRIVESKREKNGTVLVWRPQGAETDLPADGPAPSLDPLYYIVHWYDEEDEVWRGVIPRTTAATALVPAALYSGGDLRVRVLATSGVATGHVETTLKGGSGRGDAREPPPTLYLEGRSGKAAPNTGTSQVLRAVAIDARGKSVTPIRMCWSGEDGRQLAGGAELDLRRLPPGIRTVTASMRTPDGRFLNRGWRVESDGQGHHVVSDLGAEPTSPGKRRRKV